MRHLAYKHTPNRPLVETITGSIAGWLARRLFPRGVAAGRSHFGRRIALGVLWILALVIQAALIALIAQLVDVTHGVMSLYLDLARQQLELTSLYVAATTP